MVIRGHISNGNVELDSQLPLPDGTRVIIVPEGTASDESSTVGGRVQVPLVRSSKPASVSLDSQHIAEILDDRDSP